MAIDTLSGIGARVCRTGFSGGASPDIACRLPIGTRYALYRCIVYRNLGCMCHRACCRRYGDSLFIIWTHSDYFVDSSWRARHHGDVYLIRFADWQKDSTERTPADAGGVEPIVGVRDRSFDDIYYSCDRVD